MSAEIIAFPGPEATDDDRPVARRIFDAYKLLEHAEGILGTKGLGIDHRRAGGKMIGLDLKLTKDILRKAMVAASKQYPSQIADALNGLTEPLPIDLTVLSPHIPGMEKSVYCPICEKMQRMVRKITVIALAGAVTWQCICGGEVHEPILGVPTAPNEMLVTGGGVTTTSSANAAVSIILKT